MRGSRELLMLSYLFGDNELVDLGRAFVDLGDARVAHVALHREVLQVARAVETELNVIEHTHRLVPFRTFRGLQRLFVKKRARWAISIG